MISYQDIVAVDLTTNSLVFFSNNTMGEFEEIRSIYLGAETDNLQSLDFDLDGYIDLTYLQNGKLEIMRGDSVSSFRDLSVFQTDKLIDKYTIYDFNADGFNDVAFLCKEDKSLYISFAKGINEFFQPVLYIKKDNLVDLVSYVGPGRKKTCCLKFRWKSLFDKYSLLSG